MNRHASRRGAAAVALAALTLAGVAAPAAAGTPTVTLFTRPGAGGGTSLGVGIAGGPIDGFALGLSNRLAGRLEIGFITPGWSYEEGSASGPPTDGVYLRLDAAGSLSLPGKVKVEATLGGTRVFEGKIQVEERPAVDPSNVPYMGLPDVIASGFPVALHADPATLTEIAGDQVTFGVALFEDAYPDPPDWLELSDGERKPVVFIAPSGELEMPLRVAGVDRWGETTFTYDWEPVVVPGGLCAGPPRITGVSGLNFPGQQLCVCGCFEDAGPLDQLQIGGRPLGPPTGLSPYVANFTTPKELAPGPYVVGWAPGAGAGGGPFQIEVIQIVARINDEVIQKGGTTALEMEIVGSDRALPVKLDNDNPEKIEMRPANSIETSTTGGPGPNVVEGVTVKGLERGQYWINWEVGAGKCPCAANLPAIAELVDTEIDDMIFTLTGESDDDSDADSDDDSDSDSGSDADSDDDVDAEDELATAWPPSSQCGGGLDLGDGRFRVEIDWSDAEAPEKGFCVELGGDPDGVAGLYSGPGSTSWEIMVKILRGCDFNQHFWVFAAAATDVEYTLRVTDTETGGSRTYSSPLGQRSPAIVDTAAFATCP